MNELKISVVTVVYNDVDNIEATIKSVLEQKYENMEYIIIDGGSSDGTVEVIKKYSEKIAFWISEEDDGIYPAQNKGFEKATGDFVNFLNSGDKFFNANVVQAVVSKLKQMDADLLYGDFNKVFPEKTLVYHYKKDLLDLKKGKSPSHQASFIRREILKKLDGFDSKYSSAAAFDFFCRFYNSTYSAIKLDLIIVDFLAGGFSSNKDLTYHQRFVIIKKEFGPFYAYKFYAHRILLEQNLKKLLLKLRLKKLYEKLLKLKMKGFK